MSTPAKSFEDLRSILGKLDRKIDSARSKRLGLDDETEMPADAARAASTTEPQSTTEDAEPAPGRSPFGRAKPLNRPNQGSGGTWIGGAGIG